MNDGGKDMWLILMKDMRTYVTDYFKKEFWKDDMLCVINISEDVHLMYDGEYWHDYDEDWIDFEKGESP